MRTEEANKARIALADQRRQYCINHRYMSVRRLAETLQISERQVKRYLQPTKAYKDRQSWQKKVVQDLIREGKTCEQVRDLYPVTERQYYYYKALINQ